MSALSHQHLKTVLDGRDEEELTVIIPDCTKEEIVFEMEYFVLRGKVNISLLLMILCTIQNYSSRNIHLNTIHLIIIHLKTLQNISIQYYIARVNKHLVIIIMIKLLLVVGEL